MMMFDRERDPRGGFGGFGGFGQLAPMFAQQAQQVQMGDGSQIGGFRPNPTFPAKDGISFGNRMSRGGTPGWAPDFGQMAQQMHRGPRQGMMGGLRRRFQGQGVE